MRRLAFSREFLRCQSLLDAIGIVPQTATFECSERFAWGCRLNARASSSRRGNLVDRSGGVEQKGERQGIEGLELPFVEKDHVFRVEAELVPR